MKDNDQKNASANKQQNQGATQERQQSGSKESQNASSGASSREQQGVGTKEQGISSQPISEKSNQWTGGGTGTDKENMQRDKERMQQEGQGQTVSQDQGNQKRAPGTQDEVIKAGTDKSGERQGGSSGNQQR